LWWSQGLITDKDFAGGLAYLVQENIIKVENVEVDPEGEIVISDDIVIPKWIHNNARWWADGAITDNDFKSGIQYMLKEEVITFKEIIRAIPSVEISSELRKKIYETQKWNELSMELVLKMKAYEVDVLQDASQDAWQKFANTQSQDDMNIATKLENAAREAKEDSLKAVKTWKTMQDLVEKAKNDAKQSGIHVLDLERAVSVQQEKIDQVKKVKSTADFKDAVEEAKKAQTQASAGLKDVLVGFGYDTSNVLSYDEIGSLTISGSISLHPIATAINAGLLTNTNVILNDTENEALGELLHPQVIEGYEFQIDASIADVKLIGKDIDTANILPAEEFVSTGESIMDDLSSYYSPVDDIIPPKNPYLHSSDPCNVTEENYVGVTWNFGHDIQKFESRSIVSANIRITSPDGIITEKTIQEDQYTSGDIHRYVASISAPISGTWKFEIISFNQMRNEDGKLFVYPYFAETTALIVVPECERGISVSAVFEGNPCDYTKEISTTIVFTEGGVPAKTPVIIRGFIKDSSGAIVEDIDTHNFGIRYVSGGYIVSSLPVDAQAVHSFRPQEPGTYEITINKVLPNHIEDGSLVTGDPIQTSPQKVTVVVPACDVGGMVQLIPVTTLNFDGKDYPITQFTLWQWQGECDDSWHYHTPTANAVEIETLTGKSDPDFNNCGFGKTSSIFISTFWATHQELQAFQDNTGIDPVGNGEAQFGGQGP